MMPTNTAQNFWKITLVSVISLIALSSCGTVGPKVQTFPSSEEAKVAYKSAQLAMSMGKYPAAIKGFKKSILLEPSPFLPHAWLATAYYSNQEFRQAAIEFEKTTELLGGAEAGGPIPLMQALSLMRAGDQKKADELLETWNTPNITVTAMGSYSSGGGTPRGIWKVAAGYLLGNVSEHEYLRKAPQEDLTFPYLIIGINYIVKNNTGKAKTVLNRLLSVPGKGRWSHAIGQAELALLNQ